MVKANHLIIHRSSTTVSSETSLLCINIFQVYINIFIYKKNLLNTYSSSADQEGGQTMALSWTPLMTLHQYPVSPRQTKELQLSLGFPDREKHDEKKPPEVCLVCQRIISQITVDCCGKSLSNNGAVKSLQNLVKLSKMKKKGTHITQTYHKRRHYEREIRH